MADPLLDPTPMGPPTGMVRGPAVQFPPATSTFVAGEVQKIVHHKDILKCDHGGKVNLDPTLERNVEIHGDLRVVTDQDLYQRCPITGCSQHCTKVIAINEGLAQLYELTGGAVPVLKNLVAVTDQGCTVKWVGFDVDKAVAGLNSRAKPHAAPPFMCAQYVKNALKDGGLPYINSPNADTTGPQLPNYGFNAVSSSSNPGGYTPQAGDVAYFPATPDHTDGHIAMYNGSQWVSDFRQNNFVVWSDTPHPRYTIYRSASAGQQAYAMPR